MATMTIEISARQYEDADDCLAAAADDASRELGLRGYDLAPRWVGGEDGDREWIALTVPRPGLNDARAWDRLRAFEGCGSHH